MSTSPPDFFPKEAALLYDERNKKLADISNCLHFLIGLILKDLPARSRILSVGAGTGAEILTLARIFPEWQFVALEPSRPMLDVCRERLQSAGFANRCEFVQGYVQDLPASPNFDAVLSVLVAHFVGYDQRADFFENMTARLRKGGILVNAEINFDLDSPEFPAMLRNWEEIQRLMGGTPESLAKLPVALREMLTVLPPSETEDLMRESGINLPIEFFRAFMIGGWWGRKT